LQPQSFGLEAPALTLVAYVRELLWRSTPLVWLGLLLALPAMLLPVGVGLPGKARRVATFLLLTGVLFVLLFSFAQGRNSPHYILTTHASLNAIAAMGWIFGARWLARRLGGTRLQGYAEWILPLLTLVMVAAQLAARNGSYPYFYTYSNPLARALRVSGSLSDYGEGFERAAAYLAAKPDAESLTAFSFRGRGPFSYFFPGTTILLNPLFMEEPRMGSMIDRLEQSDYLVFNDALPLRTARTRRLATALQDIEAELTLPVQGAYDIHIYNVADLPESFYTILTE